MNAGREVPMDEKKTILDVRGLCVDFETDQGTIHAVRDVHFQLKVP